MRALFGSLCLTTGLRSKIRYVFFKQSVTWKTKCDTRWTQLNSSLHFCSLGGLTLLAGFLLLGFTTCIVEFLLKNVFALSALGL